MDAKHFPPEYFLDRQQNNPKRLIQFNYDANFLARFVSNLSSVCDVGCSTGEFLEEVGWRGPRFGMEVSDFTINFARGRGFDFSRNIFSEQNFFGVVLFRGTLQHVDMPFRMLHAAFDALEPGGSYLF